MNTKKKKSAQNSSYRRFDYKCNFNLMLRFYESTTFKNDKIDEMIAR